jgi:general secretion pathway protein I
MRSRKNTRGFTLLEMIVATLIMSIAVVGLLSGIAGAVRNAARVREYDRVVQLARLRMNDLLSNPSAATMSDQFNPVLTGGVQAGWQAQVSPFLTQPEGVPVSVGLDRVLLQVWWMSGDDRRTFTLEGFREHLVSPAGGTP